MRLNERDEIAEIHFHLLDGFEFILNVDRDGVFRFRTTFMLERFDALQDVLVVSEMLVELLARNPQHLADSCFIEFVVHLGFAQQAIHRLEGLRVSLQRRQRRQVGNRRGVRHEAP